MSPPRADLDGSVPDPTPDEVASWLSADPGGLPDAAVLGAVRGLQAHLERGELARLRFAAAVDGRTLFLGDGARSAGAWLAARLGIGVRHAHALVHDGRALRACPLVEQAWEAGRIGGAKGVPLLRAREVHPVLYDEHVAGLIEAVVPLNVAQATIVINRWKACAKEIREHERQAGGPEGDGCGDGCGEGPGTDPAADNRFHLSPTMAGRRVGDLDLDAVSGAALEGAIGAWIDARFADGTFHREDGLKHSQRCAQALVDLCCSELPVAADDGAPDVDPPDDGAPGDDLPDQGAPGSWPAGSRGRATKRHGEARPAVSLLLDAKTLAGEPIDDLDDLLARRCELDDGTPVPLTTAQRLLCTARVRQFLTRVATDGTIETLGVTDVLRDATRQQRRALQLRHGGCAFPGCSAPFERCHVHHLDPYELDGPTLLRNLVPLCSFHHHLVHEGRWRLWRTDDGRLHLVKPDRTYVPVVGHGRAPRADRPPGTGPPPPPPLPVHRRMRAGRDGPPEWAGGSPAP